jgi:hypothetical protein
MVPTTHRKAAVPLFMDIHEIDGGVAMEDVAKAHLADLQTQTRTT